MPTTARHDATPDPLTSPGWRAFNQWQWGVQPELHRFGTAQRDAPSIEVVAYHDRKGRFVLPPLNPHFPVVFRSTTPIQYRCQRQWTRVAEWFVAAMLERGISGRVALPPEIADLRPWTWAGFLVRPLYTIFIDFPFEASQADPKVRQKIRKATRSGYTCRRADDPEDVLACLRASEARQGFRHKLSHDSLRKGLKLLGSDMLRLYACYAPDGDPAAARIVLHAPGARACDLAAGTSAEHLPSGATQALIAHVLEDLEKQSATGLNFGGANLPGVAPAKAAWGGHLLPHFAIEGYDRVPLLDFARDVRRYLRARRRIRKGGES
jgi:hypothetical protein